MKHGITFSLALSSILLFSGCASGEAALSSHPAPSSVTAVSKGTADLPAQAVSAVLPAKKEVGPLPTGRFSDAAFQGKIRQVYAGKENSILVLADKLYLYDTQSGNVTASASCSAGDFSKVFPCQNGYAVITQEDAGSTGTSDFLCIQYDASLNEISRISLNSVLTKDQLILEEGQLALSEDGAMLAAASLNALYLYDIAGGSLKTLLQLSNGAVSHGLELCGIAQLEFVSGGKKLAFLGDALPVTNAEGQTSTACYGTIGIDGTQLQILQHEGYSVGDVLMAQDDLLLLPEVFTKASGRLLAHTVSTGEEVVYPLTLSKEGKDGVFLSQQGGYFATASLGAGMTIRIYERSSGKLVKEFPVTHDNPLYFARVPRMILLDGSRTCIALLGTRQDELDTLPVCFGF